MSDTESIIIWLILLLTSAGVVDCWFTLGRIRKEQERLAEFCDPGKKPGKYFDDGLLEDFEQRELLDALDQREKETGRLLLVDQRWAVMLKAVKEDNAVRRIPSFTSLRAVNLQQSYATHAVWLRVVMPMLLVLGICGTLVGVHGALGMPVAESSEQQAMMMYVSQALLPGILATFCTIVLMVFRGFYRRAFNEMMQELDNMTLCVFLPSLQIQSHLGVTIEDFCSHVGKLTEFAKACNEVHKKTESGFDSLVKVCDVLSGDNALRQLADAVARFGTLLNTLICCRRENAAFQPKMVSWLERLCRWQSALRDEMRGVEFLVKEYIPCAEGGALSASLPMQAPLEEIFRLRHRLLQNWERQQKLCAAVNQNLMNWLQQATDLRARVDSVFQGMDAFFEQLTNVAKMTEGATTALASMRGCMDSLRETIPALRDKAGAVSLAVVADQLDGAFASYCAAFAELQGAQSSLTEQCQQETTRVWEYQKSLPWMERLRGVIRTRIFFAKIVALRMGRRILPLVKWLLVVIGSMLVLAAVVYGIFRAVQIETPVHRQMESSPHLSPQQGDLRQQTGRRVRQSQTTPDTTVMGNLSLEDDEANTPLPRHQLRGVLDRE